MAAYDKTIEYTKDVQIEDLLSRFPLEESTNDFEISSEYVTFIDNNWILQQQIQSYTEKDQTLQQAIKWIREGWPNKVPHLKEGSEMVNHFKLRYPLIVQEGCIWLRNISFLPRTLR